MPLTVYGLMCPVCLTSLQHLGEEESDGGGQLPLVSAFSHPLEKHRFRRLQNSVLALEVLRQARKMNDVVADGEDYRLAELDGVLTGFSRYYGCGNITLYLSSSVERVTVNNSWKEPKVYIPGNLPTVSSEQEMGFLILESLYPLFAGTLALCHLAEREKDNNSELCRWLEAVRFSADRFAASFFTSPALWLRARLKESFRKGDSLVSLLDSLSRHFPEEPAAIAKLLKGRAELLRRLLELAEFHRSDTYSVLASRELLKAATTVPEGKTVEIDEPVQEREGKLVVLATGSKDNVASPVPVHGEGPTLSGDLLYLSSFRNELCVAMPSLRPFHSYPLSEWCRHPRYVTFDKRQSIFYISDFEVSKVFAMDVHGHLVGTRGEKGKKEGQLLHPTGVAVDGEGNLWVADSWNDRLLSFSAQGEHRVTAEGFHRPMAIVWDEKRGGLWVADMGANQIVKTGAAGEILFTFGKGELDFPEAIDLDNEGNVVVADTGNGLVKRFAPAGTLVDVKGRGGLPGERPMRYPQAVAVGPRGELVVAERGGAGLSLFYTGIHQPFTVQEPLPDGHGCGFPCDLHVLPGLVRSMGKA